MSANMQTRSKALAQTFKNRVVSSVEFLPMLNPPVGLPFHIPKKMLACASGLMVMGVLVFAQCAIDIPGVDIPDLKDIPGVWSWLQQVGFHQVQVDLLKFF